MSDQTDVDAQLRANVAVVMSDVGDMKAALSKIAEAVSKLAVLEDRQSVHAAAAEKVLGRLELLEERQHATELRQAQAGMSIDRLMAIETVVNEMNQRLTSHEVTGKTVGRMGKGLWALIGGAIAAGGLWQAFKT